MKRESTGGVAVARPEAACPQPFNLVEVRFHYSAAAITLGFRGLRLPGAFGRNQTPLPSSAAFRRPSKTAVPNGFAASISSHLSRENPALDEDRL